MATVADLRDRLRRPLERELQSGCRDAVVVGGLERLIERVGRPFADVAAALDGYAGLDPATRRTRLERALAMLADGAATETKGTGAPRAAAAAAPARRGPVAADTRSGAQKVADATPSLEADGVLDRPLAERVIDVGAQAPRKLEEIGLLAYRDLLEHVPRRWEDRRALPSFEAVVGLEHATVAGVVRGRKALPTRRGPSVLRVLLEDATGARLTAIWFNQPWLENQLFPGQRLIVTGRVRTRGGGVELHVTGHEVDDDGPSLSTGRIVAIYPTSQGTSQAYLRQAVDKLLRGLGRLGDPLPRRLLRELALVDLDRAWRDLHQPADEEALAAARARLTFDEYLLLELRVLLQREGEDVGRSHCVPDAELERFLAALPFALTGAQERAIATIRHDLAEGRQMARLLQGDVGSGKTAVAAAAVWIVVRSGAQAALMAPTEILARQHFINLQALLWPLGVRCDLLLGTSGAAERRAARARIAAGETDLVVGTHALIQDGVSFVDLGLAVIDEEHRFGVEQRRRLIAGAPDVLVMSATPIPRSLALTAYGDLDLTVIDELPPGRTPITTVLRRARDRTAVYREALVDVRAGHQVYVVAPLIEDSEALDEVVSATQLADDLRVVWGDEVRLGLLHGRMQGADKEAVMESFRRGDLDVLVSTTVIEVGVDIPNATVMLVENAERFGLAQLHQLRGRVGRGSAASRCVLIAGDAGRTTMQRLRVVERHADGFVIAEKDLELRGPGELRGTRQSGLADLRFGDLAQDVAIIERAREIALRILAADPRLEAPWSAGLRAELVRQQRAAGFRETL